MLTKYGRRQRFGSAADVASLQHSILDKVCAITCNGGKRLLLRCIPLETPKDLCSLILETLAWLWDIFASLWLLQQDIV